MEAHPRHILVATCLVRNAARQLLLVRHHRRGWELPQGRVEEGESLQEGLRREVLEETGVTIEGARLVVIWSKISPPAAQIHCFVAGHAAGEPRSSAETPEVAWCSENEALLRVEHPVNRDRLADLLQGGEVVRLRSYATGPYRLLD